MPREKTWFILNNRGNYYSGLDSEGMAIFDGPNINTERYNNSNQAFGALEDLYDAGALNSKEVFTISEFLIQV